MNKCLLVIALCMLFAITSTACKDTNSDVKVDVETDTDVNVEVNENTNAKTEEIKVDKNMKAFDELGMKAERVTIDIDEVTDKYIFLFEYHIFILTFN